MQPIIKDAQGIIRFKENKLVRALLDESQRRGFGLNELAMKPFSQADWEQFNQLIGYSLCGYHELSFVSDESCAEATAAAKKVSPDAGGCRDDGCPLHVGVPRAADGEPPPDQVEEEPPSSAPARKSGRRGR